MDPLSCRGQGGVFYSEWGLCVQNKLAFFRIYYSSKIHKISKNRHNRQASNETRITNLFPSHCLLQHNLSKQHHERGTKSSNTRLGRGVINVIILLPFMPIQLTPSENYSSQILL